MTPADESEKRPEPKLPEPKLPEPKPPEPKLPEPKLPDKRPETKRPEPKRLEPKRPEPKRPRHSARTVADKAAREQRLAEEMRKNLRKRKAQAREQRDQGKPD